MHHRARGFTLIELMITLAIAAILATLGAPSFSEFIISNRITAQTNDLINGLNLARSEAVRRGQPVCIKSNSATANDWTEGWQIYSDPNANRTSGGTVCSTTGATIIQSHDQLTGDATLTSSANFSSYIRFNALGVATNSSDVGISGSFSLCRKDSNSAKSKLINISTTGLIRLSSSSPSC